MRLYAGTLVALLALAAASGPAPGRADELDTASAVSFLQGFAGSWRGTGAVRTARDKPHEKLVCRVEGAVVGAAPTLELRGRCGGERFTGTFRLTLTYEGATGRYKAVWRDQTGSQSPPLTGLRNGQKLLFKIGHNDLEAEGRAISTLIVDSVPGSQFRIFGETRPATGQAEFVSAALVFERG